MSQSRDHGYTGALDLPLHRKFCVSGRSVSKSAQIICRPGVPLSAGRTQSTGNPIGGTTESTGNPASSGLGSSGTSRYPRCLLPRLIPLFSSIPEAPGGNLIFIRSSSGGAGGGLVGGSHCVAWSGTLRPLRPLLGTRLPVTPSSS